jgi:hypothetical protein
MSSNRCNHLKKNRLSRREVLFAAGATLISGGALSSGAQACEVKGTPLESMHLHLCAFHVAKDDPSFQLEAHHYCMPLRDDGKLFQCIVTDSNKPGAKILGVEYIVTDDLYRGFSTAEKVLWHPHDYEVTSGLLLAPKLSEEQENKFMAVVRQTWGKTFHTWPDPSTAVPLGQPRLMWAFTKDGELREELLMKRDKDLGISTEKIKKRRVGKV